MCITTCVATNCHAILLYKSNVILRDKEINHQKTQYSLWNNIYINIFIMCLIAPSTVSHNSLNCLMIGAANNEIIRLQLSQVLD